MTKLTPLSLEVIYTPAQIARLPERDLSNATAVVIDVLRATSTITTGLANGAAGFYPVETVEEARELKKKDPTALLAGERFGEPPEGFDLGNSPLEFTPEKVGGKKIYHTTTNGTRAFVAARGAKKAIAAAFLNLQAVVESLHNESSEIMLICAGTHDDFSFEDALCAGAIADALAIDHPIAALYRSSLNSSLFESLKSTRNGRALCKAGRENDVRFCAQLNLFQNVPLLQKEGWIK